MPRKEIAHFSVPYLQILAEDGTPDIDLDPELEPPQLVALYRSMVHAREADERMLKLQRQGRLGTFPPCIGQEAAVCGPALAMRSTDWLVGAYRELGARLLRGEPLERTLQYYRGMEEGSAYPKASRNFPIQVILGSQLPHAVGIAYAMRLLGESETAVVAFVGDGATSQGDFHEALNFAGVWRAPVVFVCQNNGWAISHPRAEQTRSETLAQKALAYGFPGIQVDGNDALATYAATRDALVRARAGAGPTLIEAVTYRLVMHTTADDPKKYRSPEEEQEWWQRDPIPRFRRYLEGRGLWDDAREEDLVVAIRQEIDDAVKRVEAMPPVAPDTPFDHVFATPTPELEAQRAELLRFVARDEDGGDGLPDGERPIDARSGGAGHGNVGGNGANQSVPHESNGGRGNGAREAQHGKA